MITIAIANQKGGTGKTTTSVTLGHHLARRGLQTLIVDTDVQGHVSIAFGIDKGPGIKALVDYANEGRNEPSPVVRARENLDILRSDKSTEGAKRLLGSMPFCERVLEKSLALYENRYHVAVIDCAPSVDVLHVASMIAADWLIIPTKLDHLAMDGVTEVMRTMMDAKKNGGSKIAIAGILPTFYERRTKESLIQLKALTEAYERWVWPPIPTDVKLREAPAFGKTIWEYAPKSRSVAGFKSGNDAQSTLVGGYAKVAQKLERILSGR